MPKPLPEKPSLEQLKKQAKDLLKAQRSQAPEALQRAQRHHPTESRDRSSGSGPTQWKLSNAQAILAREYGIESWAKLKQDLAAGKSASGNPLGLFELFHKAFREDDALSMGRLFQRYPAMKARINEPVAPVAPFDSPVITAVRSRQMLDVLLAAGADINAKSRWWAGGFGLLHNASPDLAAYAISRGADVDIHAAARLGMLDRVREWIARDPALVHARGGDGQTPLHFAGTVEIAAFLLDHGADIDARDVDHESTPAQDMIGERQEIARYLIECGCKTDLLMAAALGDRALAERLLAADPACIRIRVSDDGTPLRWAVHGSENGWHRAQGHYGKTVELLINAGAKLPDKVGGTAEVQAALRQHKDSSCPSQTNYKDVL